MFVIEKAENTQAKAKVALVGPAGCGKTYTALVTAKELGKNIIVIDTENKTSAKYVRQHGPYDIMALPDYSIQTYIEALDHIAALQKYDVVIVDSLSHAWAGKGGALEQAEQEKAKFSGNKFAGWGVVTPFQNRLVDTILNYPTHLIATMRMKIEYALVTDDRGKQVPQKLGMGIIQRDSFEYEFDIIGQMDTDHNLVITKTRCFELDGFITKKPDGQMGRAIANWLSDGEPVKMFASLDDLLFQLNIDFHLKEDEAKGRIKELGFTSLPKGNGELKRRLQEIYIAVKADTQVLPPA
jgi:hypothetical protein